MNVTVARSIGTGAVGYGGNPSRTRTTPELCPYFFHPPATFNPWLEQTWCLCGRKQYPGDRATHVACCDGPLTEITDAWIEWQKEHQGAT